MSFKVTLIYIFPLANAFMEHPIVCVGMFFQIAL